MSSPGTPITVTLPREQWEQCVLPYEPVKDETYTGPGLETFNVWSAIKRALTEGDTT